MPEADVKQDPPSNSPNLDILDYLLIIARHKQRIFLITFTVAVLSVIYTLTLNNVYTAKTLVMVAEDDKGLMGALLGSVGGASGGAAALAGFGGPTKTDLYVTMLKTEIIKDALISKFDLITKFKAKNRSFAYRKLDNKTKVSAGKKDGVITIEVSDKDPNLAADLANTYAEELGNLAVFLNQNK